MNNYLKIVSLGDLHFGHARVSSETLYNELKDIVYPELKDTHLVTLGGDIYDQLTTVGSQAHYYASKFVKDLFAISHRTGMQVRILHGTFTHDRDQLTVFKSLAYPKSRYAIVNNISCEELSDFMSGEFGYNGSIRIGYLPDNLSYKESSDAVDHLRKVMNVAGYSDLDILVGHGTFEHVIPPHSGHKPACLYREDQFTDIVHGIIIMSHIHTSSRKSNIYYCGSFERMAHGEEENKGFYVFTKEEGSSDYHARFVVNHHATPFVTIIPSGHDLPTKIEHYKSAITKSFPVSAGFVRVLDNDANLRSILHKYTSENYPNIAYSSKSLDKNTPASIQVEDISLDVFEDVKPDIHNLPDLVYQFLEEKNMTNGLTKEEISECVKFVLDTAI